MTRAVCLSTTSLNAAKSPKDDFGSAFLARMYAVACGDKSPLPTSYVSLRISLNGTATAAPAGDTCLKEAAAGRFNDCRSSETSCQAFNASSRLMYPGFPFSTLKGKSVPSFVQMNAVSCCGLHPYFNGTPAYTKPFSHTSPPFFSTTLGRKSASFPTPKTKYTTMTR
eukprot:TRINITY_DN4970_c0_g1_i1.p1 TRINITY_DN4970_c0_g1~~TRINITY_DN4970_c0_g1_i1.p1  ORF type:complete len:168 (+),score=15.60 TRINITY_DN4970_c0_g1_i1:66-569(+)